MALGLQLDRTALVTIVLIAALFRAFVEREGSLFEQVLLPYRRQRNPEARAREIETLGELAGLGRRLRTALLQQNVRRTFGN